MPTRIDRKYFKSELCNNMLFSCEKDADDFDNYLKEYCENPLAIEEFKATLDCFFNNKDLIVTAINNNIFHSILDTIGKKYGEPSYSKKLLELCQNMVKGRQIEDNDYYSCALNYIWKYIVRYKI